ncbi:hypothetical protein RM844_10270 [Streptomyces sp. DSM 44915]|uniref:N-acylglucosamine-6-phosphate 2-epimerase n=1 Tax=Streptomyces chisholmiae TaxID=3075540 RepID=A0ABU2JP43_9ACTN|nr:hypothetical protein [Streptomyces sp. DSM 44915]MDT0266677.1 hypothetical protein [Streptomyces sp. DSM 44915]
MVIKIGPVCSVREAELVGAVDIIVMRLGVADDRASRTISEATFAAVRAATGAVVALRAETPGPLADTVRRLAPDYVEFTAVDAAKTEPLAAQLATLTALDVPLIATVGAVLKDDVRLLAEEAHLARLVAAGAHYLAVELESVLDPDFRIAAPARRRLAEVFARYPVLVTDAFTDLTGGLGLNETGSYLELGDGRTRPQSFRLPTAVRLLRTRRPAPAAGRSRGS